MLESSKMLQIFPFLIISRVIMKTQSKTKHKLNHFHRPLFKVLYKRFLIFFHETFNCIRSQLILIARHCFKRFFFHSTESSNAHLPDDEVNGFNCTLEQFSFKSISRGFFSQLKSKNLKKSPNLETFLCE